MQPLSEASKSPPVDDCARKLLETLPSVVWFIRRQMRGNRRDLSLPQFRTLVRVDRQPETNLSDVADHLGCSLPTTSRIVAGLVAKDLLTRAGCRADRRQMSLALTARGRAMLERARRATRGRLETELAPLPDVQRETVIAAMDILNQVFGAQRSAASTPAGREPARRTPPRSRRSNNRGQGRGRTPIARAG